MRLCLNVGAGTSANPTTDYEAEWVRLDADPEACPDVLHDITQPLPEDQRGKYDVVVAAHVLEHVSWWEAVTVLGYILEAARPDGVAVLVVPDIEWACKRILTGHYDDAVVCILYGGQDGPWNFHKCGWTPAMLTAALDKLGWKARQITHEPYQTPVGLFQQVHVIAERKHDSL